MNYTDEKGLFLRLSSKPKWLNSTEWNVLKFYYVPLAPCEPNRAVVLEKAKKWVRENTRFNDSNQAFRIAKSSVKTGIDKVRTQLKQPQTQRIELERPRTRYEMSLFGLD